MSRASPYSAVVVLRGKTSSAKAADARVLTEITSGGTYRLHLLHLGHSRHEPQRDDAKAAPCCPSQACPWVAPHVPWERVPLASLMARRVQEDEMHLGEAWVFPEPACDCSSWPYGGLVDFEGAGPGCYFASCQLLSGLSLACHAAEG